MDAIGDYMVEAYSSISPLGRGEDFEYGDSFRYFGYSVINVFVVAI